MTAANTIITINDLGVVRQGSTILKDISFTMASDQRLAIMGPNGAGKSFLLRILSADMIPSHGTVTILGQTFGQTSLWDLRREIGFVATRQVFRFPEFTTVHDLVASGFFGTYGLANTLTSPQQAKVDDVMAFFTLTEMAQRDIETLSDGERRKALLARALVLEPKLLIFDEPCIGLDIPSRDRFLEDIDRLAEEIPIIYVTHHVEELPRCITDVLYLKDGAMAAHGDKQALLTSEQLSTLFDYSLDVIEKDGRFYVQHL